MLRDCELPEEMDKVLEKLTDRLQALKSAQNRFKDVYLVDLTQFYEYYIPEALQLTASYLEYRAIGIGEEILKETKQEVLDVSKKLLVAVNDTIDQIYKFATMEIKAKAKALDSIMSQDGYVDPVFKIN